MPCSPGVGLQTGHKVTHHLDRQDHKQPVYMTSIILVHPQCCVSGPCGVTSWLIPGGLADTGASPYPAEGAGQPGLGAGPVPFTEGCRPRGPGLAMATGDTAGERPGPARGTEVCNIT